jgi:hypothetical protein
LDNSKNIIINIVNKLLSTKSLLTSPSNVLPLHLKQTFLPIIWIFTQGEEDEIESKLSSKSFLLYRFTLLINTVKSSHTHSIYFTNLLKGCKLNWQIAVHYHQAWLYLLNMMNTDLIMTGSTFMKFGFLFRHLSSCCSFTYSLTTQTEGPNPW